MRPKWLRLRQPQGETVSTHEADDSSTIQLLRNLESLWMPLIEALVALAALVCLSEKTFVMLHIYLVDV